MKINCLSCGHILDLHSNYDDYDGQARCYVCGGLMTIHTESGQLKHAALTSKSQHDDARLDNTYCCGEEAVR
jgi:hypothetical protein